MTKTLIDIRNQNYVEAGKTLKQWRLRSHLSQNFLAEKVGMNFTYFNKIERGSVPYAPKEAYLLKIADVLEIPDETIEQVLILYGRVPSRYEKVYCGYYKMMPALFRRIRQDPDFADRIFAEAHSIDPDFQTN